MTKSLAKQSAPTISQRFYVCIVDAAVMCVRDFQNTAVMMLFQREAKIACRGSAPIWCNIAHEVYLELFGLIELDRIPHEEGSIVTMLNEDVATGANVKLNCRRFIDHAKVR